MAQLEKSVFISYRRTNSYHALAIFQHLHTHGYDVFMDYEGVDVDKFEDIILHQIKARAHFIVILTPSALEYCDDPNDWLRTEIITAMQHERNIVPIVLHGFDGKEDIIAKLPDELRGLEQYEPLAVPASLAKFQVAMDLLRNKFLDKVVEVVLHPTPVSRGNIIQQMVTVATSQPVITETHLIAGDYFEQGNKYRALGDNNRADANYDHSVNNYYEIVETNPEDAMAYYNRANAYRHISFSMAIDDYTEALELNPKLLEIYTYRGLTYLESADYTSAIDDLLEAIRLNPKNAFAYSSLGDAYFHLGDFDNAIINFDEAIRLNPKSSNAYQQRAEIRSRLGNYDSAVADYSEATSLEPQDPFIYIGRGYAYRDKKDFANAIIAFTEAIRIKPEQSVFYVFRGQVYEKNGDYDGAIADFTEALRLAPLFVDTYHLRALAYMTKGDYVSALADLDKALEINPQHSRIQHERTYVLGILGTPNT